VAALDYHAIAEHQILPRRAQITRRHGSGEHYSVFMPPCVVIHVVMISAEDDVQLPSVCMELVTAQCR